MDGMTATRLLRERGITVPIVGVTGNALDEDIRSFVEAGANEILVSATHSHWAYGEGEACAR
jgi:CheY-like chemotaxis protein